MTAVSVSSTRNQLPKTKIYKKEDTKTNKMPVSSKSGPSPRSVKAVLMEAERLEDWAIL